VLRDVAATREKEASELLFQVRVKSEALAKTDDKAAADSYDTLIQKYPSSRAAFEAELLAGDIWMAKDKYTEAEKRYSAATEKAQDNFSKLLALYNLGAAQENAGEFDRAVQSYSSAEAVKTSEFMRPELLMSEARCYEALKNIAKATEIYKLIQDKYPAQTFYSGAAAVFLSELSTKR
jgi:TolA-binding protein